MKLETFVSSMMEMSVCGRLWHWSTESAQHHVTYEKFLTQNEQLTDSFVESAMGNDAKFAAKSLSFKAGLDGEYNITSAREKIASYRGAVYEMQSALSAEAKNYESELTTILDDVIELCSKTLYLLKLK